MVMQLSEVVPFGRSLAEYQLMFKLSSADLQQRILGVGDGPASFNAEGTALGYSLTSADPLYQFTGQEIKSRFEAVLDNIISQIEATPDNWVWNFYRNPQELKAGRTRTMELFLEDYVLGREQGRYLTQALPNLDFADHSFALGLCSHFLFLYSELCDRDFHLEAIAEMLRVCREVRIFPLLTLRQETSPHLEPVTQYFQQLGYEVNIEPVNYELQPGGNQMLVLRRQSIFPSLISNSSLRRCPEISSS